MALGKRDRDLVRGLAGPKQWREADAQRALLLLATSGLSRAAFAREFGLTATRLAWWERRLSVRDDESAAASSVEQTRRATPRFVELVATGASGSAAARLRVGAVEVAIHRLDASAAQFVMELARLHEERSCS
jgi:hypothetical protein